MMDLNGVDMFVDQLILQGSPQETVAFGDSQLLPRIGSQYQVDLTALEAESYKLIQRPSDADGTITRLELSIPVAWVSHERQGIGGERKRFLDARVADGEAEPADLMKSNSAVFSWMGDCATESSDSRCVFSEVSTSKLQYLDKMYDQGHKFKKSSECDSKDDHIHMGINMHHLQQRKTETYSAVPDSQTSTWTDDEKEGFVLGLYIFGKNLALVREFMNYKVMGNILHYYYGSFYKSSAHKRWSECKKNKSKRCIYGQSIFTGWRQQEILSRLLHEVPQESQFTLIELSKSYSDGGISFKNYVSSLISFVGMKSLVLAIGIGKRKRDLTGTVLDSIRSCQVPSSCPDIPTGRGSSSLTSGDIINYLTGNFRLSKTRSNDLFWEAVWPRLLANGWHSEQPEKERCVSSKNVLVFLVPGVKKFSKTDLVKGDHYFDSVSDVLKKVASDRKLIELDDQAKEGHVITEEEVTATGSKWEKNCPVSTESCHLDPRLSDCASDIIKFTIVDTSLIQREAPFKIRGFKSLPVDNTSWYTCLSSSDGMGCNSSQENIGSGDSSLNDEEQSDRCTSSQRNDFPDKGLSNMPYNEYRSQGKRLQSDNYDCDADSCKRQINGQGLNVQCPVLLNVGTIKDEFSRSLKSIKPVYLSPLSKRRRLTVCKNSETNRNVCFISTKGPLDKTKRRDSFSDAVPADCCLPQVTDPCTTTEEARPCENIQERTLIDLNLPQCPPDFEIAESCRGQVGGGQNDMTLTCDKYNQSNNPLAITAINEEPSQPPSHLRRQSTRNRPLTAKALEALAYGYYDMKQKGIRASSSAATKSSRRPRKISENSASSAAINLDSAPSEVTLTRVPKVDEDIGSFTTDTTSFRDRHTYYEQSER